MEWNEQKTVQFVDIYQNKAILCEINIYTTALNCKFFMVEMFLINTNDKNKVNIQPL